MTSQRESLAGSGLHWRLPIAFAVLVAGVAVVAGLAPGGLGSPDPVIVDRGLSAALYRAMVVTSGPSWLHGGLEKGAALGLLVLGGLLVLACWRGRTEPRVLAGGALTLAATVTAYVASEALKLVVDEERPCRVDGLPALPDCPAAGDWSFPSNHATLAAALAVGIVLVRPRLGALAVLVAAAVGVLRMLAGAHYPHDVLAGAALGAMAVAVAVLTLTPAGTWLLARLPLPAAAARSVR
jgi:membrane-associated phospholipid phosphatase